MIHDQRVDLFSSVALCDGQSHGCVCREGTAARILWPAPGHERGNVHRRLRKIATQQKEEKKGQKGGEQKFWILKRDSTFKYLLTKFDHEHRLTWITVVAHPNRVTYADLANLELATKATVLTTHTNGG